MLVKSLPFSASNFFEDTTYFSSMFNSGFKYLFKNIRDVKRYMNSLRFNILHLIQEDIVEINPIDFLAIEAIRVFEPEYCVFLANNKALFVDIKTTFENTLLEESKNEQKNIYMIVLKNILVEKTENI